MKIKLLILVMLLGLFPETANALFNDATSAAKEVFGGLQTLAIVLSGFGLIGFTAAAIFGKLNWKWLAMICVGLFILASAQTIAEYVTSGSGKNNGGYNSGPVEGSEDESTRMTVVEDENYVMTTQTSADGKTVTTTTENKVTGQKTTETVTKNDDGTTTTTSQVSRTNSDGMQEKTTKTTTTDSKGNVVSSENVKTDSNGVTTKETVQTNSDGGKTSSTETTKNVDGTTMTEKTTTTTDKNGNTTSSNKETFTQNKGGGSTTTTVSENGNNKTVQVINTNADGTKTVTVADNYQYPTATSSAEDVAKYKYYEDVNKSGNINTAPSYDDYKKTVSTSNMEKLSNGEYRVQITRTDPSTGNTYTVAESFEGGVIFDSPQYSYYKNNPNTTITYSEYQQQIANSPAKSSSSTPDYSAGGWGTP